MFLIPGANKHFYNIHGIDNVYIVLRLFGRGSIFFRALRGNQQALAEFGKGRNFRPLPRFSA